MFVKEKYIREAEWISEHCPEFKYSSAVYLDEKYNSENDVTVCDLMEDLK